MSTAYVKAGAESFNNQDANLVTWVLALGEAGQPFVLPGYADRSIHFFGTFGGASVALEGSNEIDESAAANFSVLTDPQGNAITASGTMLKAVAEMTRVARPKVTGGDGTTQITCVLFAKR